MASWTGLRLQIAEGNNVAVDVEYISAPGDKSAVQEPRKQGILGWVAKAEKWTSAFATRKIVERGVCEQSVDNIYPKSNHKPKRKDLVILPYWIIKPMCSQA